MFLLTTTEEQKPALPRVDRGWWLAIEYGVLPGRDRFLKKLPKLRGFGQMKELLEPGGTILFDDYAWSYRSDEEARGKAHTRGYVFPSMSEAEYTEPQIKAVFELLVMQHSGYTDFTVLDDQVAMATKSTQPGPRRLLIDTRYSLKYRAISWLRKSLRPVKAPRAAR